MSKIVIVGDVMLDISISGSVTRIAPEAPIGIITEVSRKETLGGAGNVYTNLIGAGEDPYFVTIAGNDDNMLKIKDKILRGHIHVDPLRKTTTKIRIYAYTSHIHKESLITRIDKETTNEFKNLKHLLIDSVRKEIYNADFILFSDYNKGFITKELINYFKKLNSKALYIGDTKNLNNIFKNFYIITPNEFEVKRALKNISLEDALLICTKKYGISHPIITRGDRGLVLIDDDYKIKYLPATPNIATDVMGAGDTFVAYLVSELSKGKTITESSIFAIKAAGIAISKEGTYTVKRNEVDG